MWLQSIFEAGESVKCGFAHHKQFYVEDLLYLLEQTAFHTTQLIELYMINNEGVC